jgi:hypothetical protein
MSVGVRELEIALFAFESHLAALREARAKAEKEMWADLDRRIEYWEGRARAAGVALQRVAEVQQAERAVVRGEPPCED